MISRKKRRKRPEGRGWKSGKRERKRRKRERKRGREDAKNGTDVRSPSVPIFASRLFVSAANASTLLFLDRMVLAVNGFMILNGQRRTMFYSVQRIFRARSRAKASRDDKVSYF